MSVSPELHDLVLKRDRYCFMTRLNPDHVCKDQWGVCHDSTELHKLTVDHVHLIPGGVRGKRAPDDEQHLVAMCAYSNIAGPSRDVRQAQRDYLRGLYPS